MSFPPRFVWTWPSWVTEVCGGIAAMLLSLLILLAIGVVVFMLVGEFRTPKLPDVVLGATALSLLYECVFDGNDGKPGHKPWQDVAQRQAAIVVIAVLAWVLI